MKKITSFLMLMLMLLVSNVAKAEVWVVDEEADGLIQDASQITSPCTEPSEGSIEGMIDGDASTFWHSQWSGGSVAAGTHYFQVSDLDLDEYFGFVFERRHNSTDQITKWGVYGVPEGNPSAAKNACTLLATVETPNVAGEYGPYASPAIQSQGFSTIRFYCEDSNGANNGGACRGYFHVAEFQIMPCKTIEDREAALKDLQNVYVTVCDYYDSFTPGDGCGQYPADLVAAFQAACDAANELGEDENATADQLKAATVALQEAYDAVVAARKPFAMYVEPGYYQIISALDFTTSVTTEDTEDPETGEIIPGETIKKHHQKGLYDNNGAASWKDVQATAPFLFKVEATAQTNTYKVTNMHNGLTFNPVSTSSAVSMAETDSLMVFDWRWDDVTVYADSTDESAKKVTTVNIRLAAQAERSSVYLHAGGHGGGAGTAGNIVGWSTGTETEVGATDWYLVPVDEATALAWIEADSPVKMITAMVDSIAAIKATFADQKAIAEDKTSVVDETQPVITEGSQFSSPYTTIDSQDATEEDIFANLINTTGTTYWHSAWESGSVAQDVHYLQVKDVNLDGTYAVKLTRRPVSGDQITKLRVKGYNEDNEELSFEDGADLGLVELPCSASDETLVSTTLFTCTPEYTVLRFYSEEEVAASSGGGSNRGYWHAKKFQIYPAIMGQGAETTQAVAHAAEIAALEEAIAAFEAGNYSTSTVSDPAQADFVAAYNAVIEANNKWQAVYADPAALRTALEAAETLAENIVEGTDPGMWSNAASVESLKGTVEKAKAYNNGGSYNAAEIDQWVADLGAAAEEVSGAANKPAAGKWYAIKFDSEATYDAKGWDKTNAENETLGNLYDCVAVPANIAEDDESQLEIPESITVGQNVRFLEESSVSSDDMAFRFVAREDGTYAIQHKSGLYLAPDGNLSLNPAIVRVNAIGLGKNLIQVESITATEDAEVVYLHAQNAGHKLVAWGATAINSNSALYIHEIDATGDANAATMAVNPNGMKIMCYPISYSVSDGDLYELAGRKVSGETQTLCFNKVEKAEAGKPVLYVNGDPAEEADEDEGTDEITLTTDATVLSAPVAYNGMHGTYEYAWPSDEGTTQVVVVAREYYATRMGYKLATMASTDANGSHVYDANGNEGRDVTAYTGWIELTETPDVDGDCDLEITIDGDLTSIENVVANLQKAGKIYTIDGKFVGNGNINTVKNMGRGIYVINGMKVAVK